MKKLALKILLIYSVLLLFSCASPSEPMPSYHYIITVKSDLPKITFGNRVLDTNTVYPYTLWDRVEGGELSIAITIFPISDTGYVLFKLYGDFGYDELNPTLKDTLKIITPIDSSYVRFLGNASRDTIIVSHL